MNTDQFDGHTPGPWYLNTPVPDPPHTIRWISDVCTDLLGATDADARLIAAAPDLLAEVKRLQHQVEAARGVLRLLYHDELEDAEWIRWFCDIEEE